jgi:hypothetical protein
MAIQVFFEQRIREREDRIIFSASEPRGVCRSPDAQFLEFHIRQLQEYLVRRLAIERETNTARRIADSNSWWSIIEVVFLTVPGA